MTTFYENQRLRADRQIRDKGQVVSVRVKSVGSVFNEATGFVTTPGTDVDHPTVGVITGLTRSDKQLVEGAELGVLLSGEDFAKEVPAFVPSIGDAVVIGAEVYEILKVTEISPGGVPVIFKLMVA